MSDFVVRTVQSVLLCYMVSKRKDSDKVYDTIHNLIVQ